MVWRNMPFVINDFEPMGTLAQSVMPDVLD